MGLKKGGENIKRLKKGKSKNEPKFQSLDGHKKRQTKW